MTNLKGKLNGAIMRLSDAVMRLDRSVSNAQINELNEGLDDLRRIRDEVEASDCVDATAIVDECAKQPYFQVQTSEGLKPAFACVAEDGARAVVIAVDPLGKWPVDSRPDAEVFEQLIWLKGKETK